jgi:predicted flap endonuclease-1-like 5' DNA nuclease
VISEIVAEDLDEVEKLLEDPKTVAAVPEELDVAAAAAAVAVAETPVAEPVAAEPIVEAPLPVAAAPAAGRAALGVAAVEGISAGYAEKLIAIGITSNDDLLMAGAKANGREKLAETTGISGKLILGWVHHADLMRIPGVGPQYSDLLEAAGVDSPAELAQRNPKNLEATVQSVAAERPGIVRRIPGGGELAGWIEEAAKLDKVVEH